MKFLVFAICCTIPLFGEEETTIADILCPDENLNAEDPMYSTPFMIVRGSEFGGKQDDYIRRAQANITRAKEKIQEAVQNKKKLSRLFFDVLEFLAFERKQIAIDHKTCGPQDFGTRRDTEGIADVSYTYFTGAYLEYGHLILAFLKDVLSQMEQDKGQFIQKEKIIEQKFLGRNSSIEIQIFDKEDIKKQRWYDKFESAEFPEDFPFELINKRPLSREESICLSRALKNIHKSMPEEYARMRMSSLTMNLMRDFPSPIKAGSFGGTLKWIGNSDHLKSFYVLATIRVEMNGKMQPLYQYLTWGYQDPENPEENPLERMAKKSIVMVVHQHESLLQETLEDIAQVFEQSIRWKGEPLSELKKRVSLLRFELSCMPFSRGSAAISEWMEAAIYEYHGLQYQTDPNRLTDLEAYAHPLLPQFFESYDLFMKLGKNLKKL